MKTKTHKRIENCEALQLHVLEKIEITVIFALPGPSLSDVSVVDLYV